MTLYLVLLSLIYVLVSVLLDTASFESRFLWKKKEKNNTRQKNKHFSILTQLGRMTDDFFSTWKSSEGALMSLSYLSPYN